MTSITDWLILPHGGSRRWTTRGTGAAARSGTSSGSLNVYENIGIKQESCESLNYIYQFIQDKRQLTLSSFKASSRASSSGDRDSFMFVTETNSNFGQMPWNMMYKRLKLIFWMCIKQLCTFIDGLLFSETYGKVNRTMEEEFPCPWGVARGKGWGRIQEVTGTWRVGGKSIGSPKLREL